MRIGPRKLQFGVGLLGLVVLAVVAHVVAGATGLLVVVLLVQVLVLLAVLELRLRVAPQLLRAATPSRQQPTRLADERQLLEEHRRALEDLQQRHSEGQARALRDAVVRLEAAIADAASGEQRSDGG